MKGNLFIDHELTEYVISLNVMFMLFGFLSLNKSLLSLLCDRSKPIADTDSSLVSDKSFKGIDEFSSFGYIIHPLIWNSLATKHTGCSQLSEDKREHN